MTKKQLGSVCRKAALVIEKDGLCKDGTHGATNGPKCAIGAMRVVVNGTVFKELDLDDNQLTDLFKEARPRSRREGLVDFNDAGRTRKHDVVQLLRDMAATAGA